MGVLCCSHSGRLICTCKEDLTMKGLKRIWNSKSKDQQVFWITMAAALTAVILLL